MSPEQKLELVFGLKSEAQNQAQTQAQVQVPNGRQCYRRILKLENGNDKILADYSMAYKRDNPGTAASTLTTHLLNLVRFAEKLNKPFADMKIF